MRKVYSRLARVEEQRNLRRAFVFSFLTIGIIVLTFFYGVPAVAKIASFVGDLKKSSTPVDKNDNTPPGPPRIDNLPEAVNKNDLTISGYAEAGATIILTLNDNTDEVVANVDGKFSFSTTINKGENILSAKAKDQAGNESVSSKVYTVVFDDEVPKIEVSSPNDGASFYGAKEKQLTIKGTTEAGSTLTISDRLIKVEDDGSFSYTISLNDGENSFHFKVVDTAGNQTEKDLKVNYSPY
jgi:hypothetical protein